GERVVEHLVEGIAGEATAHQLALGPRLAEELAHEEAFELLGRGGGGLRLVGGGCGHGDAGAVDGGHRTSSSARSAPAASRACRMAIKSRGFTPSASSAAATSATEAPAGSTWSSPGCSSTFIVVDGVTAVAPLDSGPGWLTCADSLMSTVRPP